MKMGSDMQVLRPEMREPLPGTQPVKMVGRHAGFAVRDVQTLHLEQLLCISDSKSCMSATQFSLIRAFRIVGEISSSCLFRPCHLRRFRLPLSSGLQLTQQSLWSLKMHDEILQVTLEEMHKGFFSALLTGTKAELDDYFGAGKWHPLEGFVLNQQGKLRVCDNACKTHHNVLACLEETIWTSSVDFILSVIRDAMTVVCPCDLPPEWMRFRVGTEDLPDAYRGLPVCMSTLQCLWLQFLLLERGGASPSCGALPVAWKQPL